MSLETAVLVLDLGKLRPMGLRHAAPGLAPCPRRAALSEAGAKCPVEASRLPADVLAAGAHQVPTAPGAQCTSWKLPGRDPMGRGVK